jgi:HAD superfamily hydrolase (TIGR01549 family)
MPIDRSRVKAILFDIDGTLSDSDDQMVARLEKAIGLIPLFLTPEKKHQAARWLVMAAESPGNWIYNLADRFDLDSVFFKMLNRLSLKKHHRIKPYWIMPGVKEMLQAMQNRFLMGVVSARDETTSLAFIHQYDLAPLFKVVVTSQTCRYTKPYPHPLLYAAQQLSVKPDECLMVGDTTVDMRAARLAGMGAIGVLCGFGTERELKRTGADLILANTADLLDLFQ